jgi:hypothetical protein
MLHVPYWCNPAFEATDPLRERNGIIRDVASFRFGSELPKFQFMFMNVLHCWQSQNTKEAQDLWVSGVRLQSLPKHSLHVLR